MKFGIHSSGKMIAYVDVKRVNVVFALAHASSSLAQDYVSLAPVLVFALVLEFALVPLPVLESKEGF